MVDSKSTDKLVVMLKNIEVLLKSKHIISLQHIKVTWEVVNDMPLPYLDIEFK